MKKFLIIAGMIMCFILGGCSIGSVDAKESSSNDDEYILKYADTDRDFTSMEVLIDKTTGVAITPRVDEFQSNGLYHAR